MTNSKERKKDVSCKNERNPLSSWISMGKKCKDQNCFLLDNILDPTNEQKQQFAKLCHPLYQRYYPDIIEEIQGIADGQNITYQDFATFLYSMYCIMPEQKCTNFIMKNEHMCLLARNSDFLTKIEKLTINVRYHLENCYAFQGNTTAFVEIEDGMNEHGLAIGLASVYPQTIQPGFQAGILIRYLLEHCQNINDALKELKRLPIASAQVLAIIDHEGHSAIIECDCQDTVIILPPQIQVGVNAFYSRHMKQKRNYNIDDWQSDLRQQNVYHALQHKELYSLEFAKDILSNRYGFTCKYNRQTGKDTIWSVIYDSKNKKIYRCEGNPARKQFYEDKRKEL